MIFSIHYNTTRFDPKHSQLPCALKLVLQVRGVFIAAEEVLFVCVCVCMCVMVISLFEYYRL